MVDKLVYTVTASAFPGNEKVEINYRVSAIEAPVRISMPAKISAGADHRLRVDVKGSIINVSSGNELLFVISAPGERFPGPISIFTYGASVELKEFQCTVIPKNIPLLQEAGNSERLPVDLDSTTTKETIVNEFQLLRCCESELKSLSKTTTSPGRSFCWSSNSTKSRRALATTILKTQARARLHFQSVNLMSPVKS